MPRFDAMTVRKNMHPYASDGIHIFTFRDGNVSKFHEFMDTAGIADAWRD